MDRDRIDFLIIFVSIVFGYAMSEYLKGIVFLIKSRNKVKESTVHVCWQVLIFFMAIQYWWTFYAYSNHVEEDLMSFFITLSIPFIYFIIIMLLFPSEDELKLNDSNMTIYFQNIRKKTYISISILFILYSLTTNLWMGEDLFHENVIIRGIITITLIIAAIINKRIMDYVALSFITLVMIYFYYIRFKL